MSHVYVSFSTARTNLIGYRGQVLAASIWSFSFRLLLELRKEVIHLQWKIMIQLSDKWN